jgi:4-amino-4-deoxy-L-arabinose transferase-like glycosyltransferase
MIFGNGVIIPRLFKAVLGSLLCVLIYRLANRNFGEAVGRMAAIFCMLMPNLILYAGIHMKEAEMVFLTVWFIERADALIRVHKYTFLTVLPTLLIGGSLFFFRTVLGVTAMFALFTALIFSSRRVMSMSNRLVITGWVIVAVAYFVGSSIASEVEEVWQARVANQDVALEYYAEREGGNKLAKYASKSVFAPMIFLIPFPTVVNTPNQQNQQLIHGGNYVKNIMAFFVLFGLLVIVKEKKWRNHILILSFTLGYLMVIALSAFAQSERFHQPALPFIMILAAFGVSNISNVEKKYFKWFMAIMFIIIVAWSWFKLSGRGLV